MSLDFSGCWAKIERAKEHTDILKSYLGDVFSVEENRVGVTIKFNPSAVEGMLYIARVPDLRIEFERVALIAGDGFQNLRSTLDHLMWQLALEYTAGAVALDPKRERRVQFPLISDSKDWSSVVSGTLADIDPRHHAIIERLQPYDGRELFEGPMLGLLRDFSNMDKHRLLIPTMILPADTDKAFDLVHDLIRSIGFPLSDHVQFMNFRIELGAPIATVRFSKPPFKTHMQMQSNFAPTVAISEHRPVIETLEVIAMTVIGVIREFQPLP